MSKYKKTNYKYSNANKEYAVLICNKCGHKEVFDEYKYEKMD